MHTSPRKVLGDASNAAPKPRGVKRNPFAHLVGTPAKKPRLDSEPTSPAASPPPPPPEPTTRENSTLAYAHSLARGASIRGLRMPSGSRTRPQPPSSFPCLESFVSSKVTDAYTASSLRGRSLSLAFSHEAKRGGSNLIASGSIDGHIAIWKADKRQAVDPVPPSFMYQAHGNMIRELSWSSDDRRLASAGADGFARITDVATGNTLSEFPQSFAVNSIIMDPHHDSLLCTVGRDKSVCVWDVRDPRRKLDYRTPVLSISACPAKSAISVTSALYLPHEQHQIVTSWSRDGILKKWDLRFLESLENPPKSKSKTQSISTPIEQSEVDPTATGTQRPRGISHLVYNERTRLIYAHAVNGRIFAHNPYLLSPSPSVLSTTYGHNGVSGTKESFYVRMSVSPCGRWLASGSSAGNAYLYALDGRPAHVFDEGGVQYQRGAVLRLHHDEVHGLDWGKNIVALASDDQLVSVWRHDEEVAQKCRDDPEAQTWNWSWANRE